MPVSTSDIPNLRKWIEEGLNLNQMGKLLGSKRQTIHAFLKKHSIPYQKQRRVGPVNGRWKGGRIIDHDGYVLIKKHDHPYKNRHSYVREHRLVMEQVLGRYLEPNEVIHHKDGNKQNNHPDNLEIFSSNQEHLAKTLEGKTPNWTPEGYKAMCQPRPHRRKSNPKSPILDGEQ